MAHGGLVLMCGIVVSVNARGVEREDIRPGLSRIRERGPDEWWVEEEAWYAAGFVRLAIESPQFSVASSNDDQDIVALLNGELWNYQALASAYGLFGIRNEYDFLREGYRRLGTQVFEVLRGMFAVVLVDKRERRVIAVRDRQGIKPLFIHRSVDSRVITLSSHVAGVPFGGGLRLNSAFFTNRYVLGFSDYRNSVFESVEQVPPASIMQIDMNTDGSLVTDVTELISKPELVLSSDEEMFDAQLSILEASVAECMTHGVRSEVPLLLSGGIDSSLLAFLISRLGFQDHVVGVHVGPPASEDAEWSSYVARQAGLRLLSIQPDLGGMFDSPGKAALSMGGTSGYTIYWLFSRLRQEFPDSKVVICGEGADELYLGYPWHLDPTPRMERMVRRRNQLEVSTDLIDLVVSAAAPPSRVGVPYEYSVFADTDRSFQLIDAHLLPFDHASMAHGFEVRVPYLATENVALADAVLERRGHAHESEQKGLLKRLLRSMAELPEAFMNRPKAGLPSAFAAAFSDPTSKATAVDIVAEMPQWFLRIPFPPLLRHWYAALWAEVTS
jgi:asparagine synthase (glutamine-hydrolysing)